MEWACIHSLSTAHVTGTVALLLGKNPRLSSSAVYQLLRTTSSGDTGGDSVDACAAVTMVVGHGSCLPSPSGAERVAMH